MPIELPISLLSARLALAHSYTEEKFLRLRVYLFRHDSNLSRSLFVFSTLSQKVCSNAAVCLFVAICAWDCIMMPRFNVTRFMK